MRTVQDYADANGIPLLWLDAVIDAAFDDPHRLAAIDVRLPMGSTALRHTNLRVAQRLVELDGSSPAAEPAVRAARLASLALALSENDYREPALQAAQEAVDLRRALAAARPDVFKPDLAASLNNLANRLSELGHREPALQAAQEAADLYRALAAARPDVFKPDLARSLYVLALRTEEAVASADSGVAACQWAHESLTVLIPAFLLLPDAHGGLLRGVVQDYLRLCKAIDTLPDAQLLEPLLPFFSTTGSDT